MPGKLQVGIRELRANLTRYLRQARHGDSILVTARGAVIAEIRAPEGGSRQERVPGSLKGEIWMADDFDRWPRDILDTFDS